MPCDCNSRNVTNKNCVELIMIFICNFNTIN